MPRPKCCRRVAYVPETTEPSGTPDREADAVLLELDELEALRLADVEGLYQDAAAQEMGISRQTFGRIVSAARRKVARAVLERRDVRIAAPHACVTLETFCHRPGCACGGRRGRSDGRCDAPGCGERRRRGWPQADGFRKEGE